MYYTEKELEFSDDHYDRRIELLAQAEEERIKSMKAQKEKEIENLMCSSCGRNSGYKHWVRTLNFFVVGCYYCKWFYYEKESI